MSDPLATLADRMVESRTIGFIGAGMSARMGLPLWGELLDALYEIARQHDSSVPKPGPEIDQRWLAELYETVISQQTSLQDVLRGIFSRQGDPSNAGYALLIRLSLSPPNFR